jgi:(1->4)-alpha-D-glucan 1-alpha-D-glucosylmutase
LKTIPVVACAQRTVTKRRDEISESNLTELAQEVLAKRRLPSATYRLQFNRSFTFHDAREIVPYLDTLGVTDVYASPCLKAGRNSNHGYDISDHNALNPTLGSAEDFDSFCDELRSRGMGLIFDVVPNHMGIDDADNAWWMDVLENGPSSQYAPFFDLDWHPLKAGTDVENRVLLPILGDPYGKALENQELVLSYENGAFFVLYHDRRMPVALRCYAEILSARLAALVDTLGSEHRHVLELQSIITALNYLPPETESDPEKLAERRREKEIIKQRIARLTSVSPEVREAIQDTLRLYNGIRGEPRSFDLLDALLENQCYRLSFWRVAAEEINYRRFFDVNELAAIRMEVPQVFEATHRLVLDLVRQGKVTGLRIDHADGLWDPGGYLRQLQQGAFRAFCQRWLDVHYGPEGDERSEAEARLLALFESQQTRSAHAPLSRPLYVVVEKILSRDENLPSSWPVFGTTGYEFANLVNGLFVDSSNRKAFTNLYASFIHLPPMHFGDLVNSMKKIIMLVSLVSEVNELGYQLKIIANRNRWYRDFTVNSLTHAIREVIAALPVYRTYLTEQGGAIEEHDLNAIEIAVAEARRRNPRTASAVFDFIRRVLLKQYPEGASDEDRVAWNSFVMRFQQTTGPVMAKGVEDTAFYVYNRLLSLNEVGGDPEQFGVSPATFHRQNAERLQDWPYAMVGGSTHDSKRSADVRARLNVLSEIPSVWRRALFRWSRQNRKKKTIVYGQAAPDRNDEYLLYQTLLGVWPLEDLEGERAEEFRQRIQDHMQKAIKEAKVHSSWVNPNRAYDDAVARFVESILTGRPNEGFLADFRKVQEFVAFYGMLNALAQTLLQLTSPGVPDIYQGNELWDFSLVDPDNRRPVDFEKRERFLDDLVQRIAVATSVGQAGGSRLGSVSHVTPGRVLAHRSPRRSSAVSSSNLAQVAIDLLENWRDGRVKLFLIHRVLQERRAHAAVFGTGDYQPLEPDGARKDHVVAFARSLGEETYVTVVPRLVVGLTNATTGLPHGSAIWGDTCLIMPNAEPGQAFENVLTGETLTAITREAAAALPMADILATFPVAMLKRV